MILMQMMVAAFFMDRTTFRTTLGRTPRVNFHYFAPIFVSFVEKELLQLVERPRTLLVIRLRRTLQIAFLKGNAGKVFDYKNSIKAIFLNECLRQAVVNICHPTVLSS